MSSQDIIIQDKDIREKEAFLQQQAIDIDFDSQSMRSLSQWNVNQLAAPFVRILPTGIQLNSVAARILNSEYARIYFDVEKHLLVMVPCSATAYDAHRIGVLKNCELCKKVTLNVQNHP